MTSAPPDGEEPAPGTEGMNRRARSTREHLLIAAYWFANNFHWGALLLILLPGDLNRLAGSTKAATLGNLTAFGAIFAVAVPLVAGALSDRCVSLVGRRRPFLLWGTATNLVGLLLMALALGPRSLPLYAAGYLVVQLGNNIALGAYMGVMPDLVIPEERGKASGFMALLSQGGTLLGAFGVGILFGGTTPLVKYGAIAFVLVAGVAIGWRTMDERPLFHRPAPIRWSDQLRSMWISPKEHPDFFWVWITRFLVMLGFYLVLPIVNYYLIDVIGIPAQEVSRRAPILLGIILVVSSFSGVYGGALSDRIGRKRVVYVANAAIAVFALGFIFTRSFNAALVVGALFGLGYGAYISVDYALGNDVLPDKEHGGKDMAVWHVAMTLPQVVGGWLAGRLLTAGGSVLDPTQTLDGDPVYRYALSGYVAVFLLCSFCFALGAVLLRNVRGAR